MKYELKKDIQQIAIEKEKGFKMKYAINIFTDKILSSGIQIYFDKIEKLGSFVYLYKKNVTVGSFKFDYFKLQFNHFHLNLTEHYEIRTIHYDLYL